MTEGEWLSWESNPEKPLSHLFHIGVSARRFRLFTCGCCRRVVRSQSAIQTIEMAERFADGQMNHLELRAACEATLATWQSSLRSKCPSYADLVALQAASAEPEEYGVAVVVANTCLRALADPGYRAITTERKQQCALLRDIFGNPFQTAPKCNPSWRTSEVIALATAIYQDRDFRRMPALADALETAGCRDPEILAHCRSGSEHVKGCWVLDLVLGKQ